MEKQKLVLMLKAAALAPALVLAALVSSADQWDPLALFFVLLVYGVVSDLFASISSANIALSGTFLAVMLAAVFLGPAPAAAIGVTAMLTTWLYERHSVQSLLTNLVAYAWFPLAAGLAYQAAYDGFGLSEGSADWYLTFTLVALGALLLNFAMVAGLSALTEDTSLPNLIREDFLPVLPSELFSVVIIMVVAHFYLGGGLAAMALFAGVLFTYQYLLQVLLAARERSKQLASLSVGVLSAMVRSLDLRDRMTARHCAAVARYSREIAQAAGLSEEDQELVHTAGLLHDIGKFIFPDHILKADVPLQDSDWEIIRRHPYQGAQVLRQMEGYGPIADIVYCHHERIDGGGYPRGLGSEEIPALARIISVADTYDVMTGRDSYRTATSSFEAIQELRRVAGTQLDAQFVAVFTQILRDKDLTYRHGDDADFDAELAMEKRVRALAAGERSTWRAARARGAA